MLHILLVTIQNLKTWLNTTKNDIHDNRYISLIRDNWMTAVNIILDNYMNLIKHMKFTLIQIQMNIQTSRTWQIITSAIQQHDLNSD